MKPKFSQDVPTSQIEPIIEAYKQLVCWKLGPTESAHPLSEHFAKYEEWRSHVIRPQVIPNQVIVLADYAVAVQVFRQDWSSPDQRSWLASRLRDPQKCLGFLWEFRYASSLELKFDSVQWLGNTNAKSPDIQVICNSGAVVFVECVARLRVVRSYEREEHFRNVILRALDRKAKQRHGFTDPLEVTLYIPEQFLFEYDNFHYELGTQIYERFEATDGPVDYGAVSGFRIITAAAPVATTEPGRVFYDRTMPSVMFPNGSARNPLPREYWSPSDNSQLGLGDGLQAV